jgi:large subunit ribosomal protein L32e
MIMSDEKRKKPKFNVPNASAKVRVKGRWRKPRGTHNKKRMGKSYMGASPTTGYRNPKSVRGLTGGAKVVLIRCMNDLEGLEKDIVLRISGRIGRKKREEIDKKAESLGLRIINPKKPLENNEGKEGTAKAAPKKGENL